MDERPCPICMRPARFQAQEKSRGFDIVCPHCMDFAVTAEAFAVIDRSDFPDVARTELVHMSRSAHAGGTRLLVNQDILHKAYARAESEWKYVEEMVAIKCEKRECIHRSEESFTVDGELHHRCAPHYHDFMASLVRGRIDLVLKALHGEVISDKEIAAFVVRNNAELRRFFRKVGAEV